MQLRAQAGAATDPATKLGLYRAAVAADPQNPWVRLDLARELVRLGRPDEARQQMAEVTGAHPTPDALKAGVIFANETNDPDAAAALIARLPPALRTADMRAAQARAAVQRQVDAALMLSRPLAREKLLEMAAAPDPDGARGAAAARALGGLGDKMAAREAVVAAQASTPGQGVAAKLHYAGALLEIGDAQGAQDMLAQLGSLRGLSAADRRQLVQMQAGLAVRASDRLNEQGKQADAYDRLAPLLAQQPQNPDLNLALARLYQGARNPREALQISQEMLRRDPGNVEARKGAVAAALQLGDRGLADELAQQGEQIAPNDPKTWMMAADVAKAQGNNGEALRDLERARNLRLQQLGYSGADTGADSAPQPGVSLVPGAAPTYQPVAPPRPAYRPAPWPNADGGADQPQSLAVPPELQGPPADAEAAVPMPPFVPQPTTALGTSPTYRPAAALAADPAPVHTLLDTSASEVVPPQVAAPPLADDTAGRAPAPEPGGDQGSDAAPQPVLPPPTSPPPPFRRPLEAQAEQSPDQDQPAPDQQPLPEQQPMPAPFVPPAQPAPAAPVQPRYPPSRPPPAAAAPPISPFAVSPMAPAERPDGYYANPFRPGSVPTPDELAVPAAPAAVPDAETEEIDRNIVALRDTIAPSVQGGFGYRNRSGSSGLDALDDLTLPLEATFSPHGEGTLKLTVTPTLLSSGTLGGDISNQQRFGTGALGLKTNATTGVTTLSSPQPGDQNAEGVGLGVAYTLRGITADVGSSPFGFREESAVGGLEWAPQLSAHVRLRLKAERRALPDSILSYAGAVDPRTGQTWGGVVQDHGRATLEFSAGKADFYGLVGFAQFTGTHVQTNTEVEGGAGGSFPVLRTPTQEARVGLNLIYFGFSHNQDFFTLGQGGYFSPQSFASALVPVSYKEQVDEDLSYEVGGAAGFASYHETAQPYYPIDPALQAALIAQQSNPATAVPGVLSEFASKSQSGFSGTAHATVDYRVTPSLHVGGRVNYAHSPAFDETIGMVFAKYLFNGADP
jgi:thioredoxin-like negative regulator of GroEL